MTVSAELYSALSAVVGAVRVDDTKLPDGYVVDAPVIIYSLISDVPDIAIDGDILSRAQRWQVSIRARDITAARTVKAAVISALHNLRSGDIGMCQFESAPGELFESDGVRFAYHIPVDFMILS